MRRARFTHGCLAGVVVALSAGWACIPHPEGDFEDFQKRAAAFPKPIVEASTFETAPPPTQSVEGLYYGACMSEIAFNNTSKIFNFYTLTKFTPEGAGGKLVLTLQALAVATPPGPPATVSKAGTVGDPIEAPPAEVDADSKFMIQLGTVNVPGAANAISGSDAVMERATLQGRFGVERFCGRLGGYVAKPEAAARELEPANNICQFVPIKDGDPTPTFTFGDYQAAACPVD